MDYNSFKYFIICNWLFYLETITPINYNWVYDVDGFNLYNDNSNYLRSSSIYIISFELF